MKKIPLTRGQFALVDDSDYAFLSQWNWYASRSGRSNTFYADRHGPRPERKVIRMHRLLVDAPESMVVDHIDGNGLNNQRKNLRVCTQTGNMMNRGKQKNNKSGHKGVFWHSIGKKWCAQIAAPGQKRHIGLFKTKEAASRAYKIALQMHPERVSLGRIIRHKSETL